MSTKKIRISEIEISKEVMPRDEGPDRDTVLEYIEGYKTGERYPPIEVFEDDERPGRYCLGDGWHRLEAQRAKNKNVDKGDGVRDYDEERLAYADDPTLVDAVIHPGGKLAAMFHAASANITHGRRRTGHDAVAAAKVAIRAHLLQNPGRRPTIEAVKDTAHVGTDIAQRAFKEMEQEAEAAVLPPKDPRGGARVLNFVPRGTNDAYPDLDENGMLPVIDLGENEDKRVLGEFVDKVIEENYEVSPGSRMLESEDYAKGRLHVFTGLLSAIREVEALTPEEAARYWMEAREKRDLPSDLRSWAARIEQYAAAVETARPQGLRVVK